LHEKLAEATWKLGNHLIACLKTEGNRKKTATCVLLSSDGVDTYRQKLPRISLQNSIRTTYRTSIRLRNPVR